MKIYWGTRLRGFLRNISDGIDGIEFISNNELYEVNSLKQKIFSKIIRCKLLNFLGIFKVTKCKNKECDMYASFNRFLNTDKSYFIYLENPMALYHYTLGRISHRVGKRKYLKCINNPNLKYIVCMSNACKNTFEVINGKLPKNVKITTVYPLVKNNKNCTIEEIEKKSKRNQLELLYCVQGVRFVSKGGLEVIETFERLNKKYNNLHLTIITKISDVNKKIIKRIRRNPNITLYDFTFKYKELEEIYLNTNILLHPTSDDSSPLTILEAMKSGVTIITTKLYAIPEMVEENINGFLCKPKYQFFNSDNMPNPRIWNNRKKTINSINIDKKICDFLEEKIMLLQNDRNLLLKMSINSFNISQDDNRFGENGIKNEWKKMLNKIKIGEDNGKI